MSSLDTLTRRLGRVYDNFKKAEKELGTSKARGVKQEFFDEATKASATTLAQRTVSIEAVRKDEAEDKAARRNPRFVVISSKEAFSDPGIWLVLMEENPALKPFRYVNKEDGRVWNKEVVDGSPVLDEEALEKADPELWERITQPKRELRPLEELDPDDLAALQEYVYPGKPIVKLAAPKQAKPEDLEDDDE